MISLPGLGASLVRRPRVHLVGSAVRSTPKGGAVVATLKPGADVHKLAEYQDSYLVSFADPSDGSAKLGGWVSKDMFSAATRVVRDGGVKADAGPAPTADAGSPRKVVCPAGMAAVVLSTAPVCKKKCSKDADCKSKAAGSCANATTEGGTVARVCASD